MTPFMLIVLLVGVAVVVIWAAGRIGVPYPIALVIAGGLLGFVPGLPRIPFEPALMLQIVLPPILFAAAYKTSWRDFRRQLRSITLLAVGLVIATTLIVGLALRWLLPDIPWAVAFAFGAIISPPDAVAATAIFSRLRAPRILTVTLEGESLLNDATGLVLYKFAVAAALTGMFSPTQASLEFAWVAAGGLALGFAAAWALQWIALKMEEAALQIVFSLVIPYVVYGAAEAVHASGVLAVIAAGLVGARCLSTQYTAEARILGWSTWQVITLLLDALVFMLIGSQLHGIVNSIARATLPQMLLYAMLLTGVCMAVRMVWMFPGAYLPRLFDQAVLRRKVSYPPWRGVIVAGWCGMRGIVSLVAALALPLTLPDGSDFPYRDEIIFLTFAVTLATLVLPGLTLAPLMRWLGIGGDAHVQEEEHLARRETAQAAIRTIAALEQDALLTPEVAAHLKHDFESRLHHASPVGLVLAYGDDPYLIGRRAALEAQRQRLMQLLREQRISDEILHEIEREIDYEEARLQSA